MNILGISCFYHDSAAALLSEGRLVAAAAEERFTGRKHDPDFPRNAIEFCLEKISSSIEDIDLVVFYDKPFTKFDRILNSYLQTVPRSYGAFRKAIPVWLREKLWLPHIIKKELSFDGPIQFVEHHLSHAAGAYYSSPFDNAAVLTIDGVGEWATASIGKGAGNKIELSKVMNYPHSLGLLYSAFTYFLGFQVNSAEYKIMGLAPYGEPIYAELIEKELIRIHDDGSIHLNMKYFAYHYGLKMTGKRFAKLFGREQRFPETELTDSDRNMAASIQAVTEKIVFKMAQNAKEITGDKNLCMSGGVALNCAAAGKLLNKNLFDYIYIQPASTDSGGSIGAALYTYYSITDENKIDTPDYFNLGPSYDQSRIRTFLENHDIPFQKLSGEKTARLIASELSDGKIVSVFQGAMEFGPRALGFRSILADPRDPGMKEKLNRKVKFREPFRPFAPVILEEKASDYFTDARRSPYMLFNFEVRPEKRDIIPAVTHVDGTARIQTVAKSDNPVLYDIISDFEKLTGVPVLLNTSFNLRGYPIVRTPEDAFATFISSGIDILAIENCIIMKKEIDPSKYQDFVIKSGND